MERIISDKELYDLLDDCHTALAKSCLDMEEYTPLSARLVDAKQKILRIEDCNYKEDSNEPCDVCPRKITTLYKCKILQENQQLK